MSACDKFKPGDYVNISPELVNSFRHHTMLRNRFPAGRVIGFTRRPYHIVVQLNASLEEYIFHMDDWERP